MKKIVLASASTRRRDILEQCGISFEVKVSDVDENIESSGPDDLVTKLSYLKAKDVLCRVRTQIYTAKELFRHTRTMGVPKSL